MTADVKSIELNLGVPRAWAVGGASVVTLLLFLAAIISYVDRGSLSIAAPLISSEMGISPVGMGVLLSSFFWTYAFMQIVSGWLTDRFPVFWVFVVGFVLWSVSTLATSLVAGVTSLIVLRLFLGAGESVLFPCFSKIIVNTFPVERRALPNAVLDAGTKLGPAIGVLVGGVVVQEYGWRMLFVVLGIASLLWLLPWAVWGTRPSTVKARPEEADPSSGPGLTDILRRPEAWGTFLGTACYLYAYFFLLTWLPSYLVQERHLSFAQMGVLGSLPYWGSAVAAVATGWGSDLAIRSGMSATVVRKTVVVSGLLLSTMALPAALAPDLLTSMAFLSVAYLAFGIFASNHWAISQTLAGPAAAGKWAGLQNCIGALSGIIAPMITGQIIQRTGSYTLVFAVPAVFAVIGAGCYLFLVREVEPIDWAAGKTVGTSLEPALAALSTALIAARHSGSQLPPTGPGHPVASADQAFAVQRDWMAQLGAQPAGWKTAGLNGAGIPLLAPILQDTVFASPAVLASDTPPLLLEVEFGLKLRADISDIPLESCEDGRELVDEVFVAFELCRSRLSEPSPPILLFLADGLANFGLVRGTGIKVAKGFSFSGRPVTLTVNGETAADLISSADADLIGDRLLWLARQTAVHGGLKGGALVITGSLTGITPIKAGDTVFASIGGVGEAEIVLSTV